MCKMLSTWIWSKRILISPHVETNAWCQFFQPGLKLKISPQVNFYVWQCFYYKKNDFKFMNKTRFELKSSYRIWTHAFLVHNSLIRRSQGLQSRKIQDAYYFFYLFLTLIFQHDFIISLISQQTEICRVKIWINLARYYPLLGF